MLIIRRQKNMGKENGGFAVNNISLKDHEQCRMEWYNDICDQNSFDAYVHNLEVSRNTDVDYKQAARLFYTNGTGFVMIELLVPTWEMVKGGMKLEPWLDAYLVKGLDDYSKLNAIGTTLFRKNTLSFANAEAQMLRFAREQLLDSVKTARSTNELLDHLTKLIEANDERFSFEWAAGGENATMEIFDKKNGIGYAVNIKQIMYSGKDNQNSKNNTI